MIKIIGNDNRTGKFENYEEFLNRTGRENNTESLRIWMNEHDLP
ncbi:MAG: hypothetical protein ACOX6I_04210 [Syntrophomonadaceae bacterium]|jgi:hypothetical protein